MSGTRLSTLMRQRALARRKAALAAAALVLDELATHGIEAVVVGSLAKGPFLAHSDVDFLMLGELTAEQCLEAERIISRHMRAAGLPYDIIFACWLADRARSLMEGTLDAPAVRQAAAAA